jgi:hypothetical protein
MRFVLKLFDTVYLPHSLKAVDKMLTNYEDADAEKVLELFDNAPLISKEYLLQLREGIINGYLDIYGSKPPKGVDITAVRAFAEEQTDKMIKTIEALPDECEIAFMPTTGLG